MRLRFQISRPTTSGDWRPPWTLVNRSTFLLMTAALTVSAVAGEGFFSNAAMQNPSGTLTLQKALGLAVLQNPQLAAFDSGIRAADARVLQAKLWPNPDLEGEIENVGGSGDFSGAESAESTLFISQLFELGGKRAARVRVARLGREVAVADYEAQKLMVLTRTAQAFVVTLAAQRRLELAQENLGLNEDALPAIERRVEAGRASKAEETRARLAISTGQIELERARRELVTARRVLSAQWGCANPQFSRVIGKFDHVEAVPRVPARLQALIDHNPQLTRFENELAQRRAQIDLEKSQTFPDLTLGAGYRYFSETNDSAAVIGFSLPLPLWNRNQGNIREAQAQLEKTGQLRAATAVDLAAQVGRAYETLRAAYREIELLTGKVLPSAEETYKTIIEGYEAGRFTQLDVLDARRVLTTSRIQLVEAQKTYFQTVAEIEGLIAQQPDLRLK